MSEAIPTRTTGRPTRSATEAARAVHADGATRVGPLIGRIAPHDLAERRGYGIGRHGALPGQTVGIRRHPAADPA